MNPEICVIVCGSRYSSGTSVHEWVRKNLESIRSINGYEYIEIVHGAAPGIDTIAGNVGTKLGYKVTPFPVTNRGPDGWGKLGRAAGPVRNKKMLDYILNRKKENPECVIGVIAFHSNLQQSKGTANMVSQTAQHNSKYNDNVFITVLKDR